VTIDAESWEHSSAVAETVALMNEERTPAIFEAALEHDGIRIRVDVHGRIAEMMDRVHPNLVGRVVRAVPGLLDTDHPMNVWDELTMPTWALGSTR
jgi:hypothetical protein